MKVIMIRSPMSVLEKDHIGYGWTKVNFSKYEEGRMILLFNKSFIVKFVMVSSLVRMIFHL